jgi:hypothetical protein
MANLPKQWGCDRMSTVRYDTSTKKAASPFAYFPSIKDNELDFGFNRHVNKKSSIAFCIFPFYQR